MTTKSFSGQPYFQENLGERFSDTVSSGSSGVSLFFEIDRDGIVVGEGHSLIDAGGERLEVG